VSYPFLLRIDSFVHVVVVAAAAAAVVVVLILHFVDVEYW
jgi:hypothetical protein